MPQEKRIVQVCEPIFLYICELNRLRREGISGESSAVKFGGVRHRVESLLESCQEEARTSNHLQEQWKKIERPLYCFLDSMIEEILGQRDHDEALPAAMEWSQRRLADEKFDIVNGNDAFFDFLQEDMDLRGSDADGRERLEFYYACLGLGFSGKYMGDAEGLNACRQDVAARVQHLLKTGPDEQITPSAYEHVNPARLNLEAEPVLWAVVVVTCVVLLFFFVATAWLYKTSASGLQSAVQVINEYGDKTQGLH